MGFLFVYVGVWVLWLVMAGAGIWLAWLLSARTRLLAVRVLVRSFAITFFFVPGVLAAGHLGSYVPVGFVFLYGIAQGSWATSWGGIWPMALALPPLWGFAYLVERSSRSGRSQPDLLTRSNRP